VKFAVGKRIRALRIEKGINLPELAEKAGVSKGFLSQLENDEDANPSLDSLHKVS
jgi:XRE family transcriptional regulator, master regulator for biofilm formation